MEKEIKTFLIKVMKEAGWAPIAVLVFHWYAARIGILGKLDWLMHFGSSPLNRGRGKGLKK